MEQKKITLHDYWLETKKSRQIRTENSFEKLDIDYNMKWPQKNHNRLPYLQMP